MKRSERTEGPLLEDGIGRGRGRGLGGSRTRKDRNSGGSSAQHSERRTHVEKRRWRRRWEAEKK